MKARLTILTLLLCLVNFSQSQNITTMGTDFWLSFMYNADDALGDQMLKVMVSGPRSCSAVLSNPNTGWVTSVNIQPGQVTEISIPEIQGFSNTSCSITNTGLHLVSTDTVSVYTMITGNWNYEISNILPYPVLKSEYMVQSYPSDWFGSEFLVLAVEDSTWVDITLTSSTSQGNPTGSVISVLIPNKGQCYQVKSGNIGDFSGTYIKARNCKKIAVFHGSVCAYIPDRPTGASCDHLEEQAIPVAYWGKRFIVASSTAPIRDRVRITALYDSCVVTKNNINIITLSSGQTYEYQFVNNSYADYIETSGPACVGIFFSSAGSGMGDPSMVNVSPVEQLVKKVTFGCRNSGYTSQHYVCIVSKSSDVQYLRLDGYLIGSYFTYVQGNPQYKFARIDIPAGSHTLTALSGDGFYAYVYGLGQHESYAYPVGASMYDLQNQIVFNNYEHLFSSDTAFVCLDDSCTFEMENLNSNDIVTWYFDDGGVSTGSQVKHLYGQSGNYRLVAIINRLSDSCFSLPDTLTTNVKVIGFDTVTFDKTICSSNYVWNGISYTSSGQYTSTLTDLHGCPFFGILNLVMLDSLVFYDTVYGCDMVYFDGQLYYDNDSLAIHNYDADIGCDSIDKLYFHMNPSFLMLDTVWGCDSTFYNGIYYFNTDTIIIDRFTSINGCDSTNGLFFSVSPSYDIITDLYIKDGDSITWLDGKTYNQPTDDPYVIYNSSAGCDSIIRLHLHIDSSYNGRIDSSALWAPNAFTPNESNNNLFSVFSVGMDYVHVYIFSREGFYITDFDGLTGSWDGQCEGKPCKQGSYVYFIEYRTKYLPLVKKTKKGTITLLR